MLFTLEALRAKKGDALLLHYGPEDDPRLFVIDGGPSGVYRQSLEPRLSELREKRAPDGALPIDLMMVSHIDDDHIRGILDLTNRLRDEHEDRRELSYEVRNLWHNAFDDIVGNHAKEFAEAAGREVRISGLEDQDLEGLPITPSAALLLASVPQGRDLRDNASLLQIPVNEPLGGFLVAPADGAPIDPRLAEDLETVLVGPSASRRDELQEKWDKELKKKGLAKVQAAAYLDESIFNLASIVVLLRSGGRSMLLTGDARGDDVLEGLEQAGLLAKRGRMHVDLLKLPHHGSDRNVELDFFRRITADHYVVSGDGSHGNPEPETFRMLFGARRKVRKSEPFTIYLTYPPEEYRPHRGEAYPLAELEEILAEASHQGIPFEIRTPAEDERSILVDLLDPYEGQ